RAAGVKGASAVAPASRRLRISGGAPDLELPNPDGPPPTRRSIAMSSVTARARPPALPAQIAALDWERIAAELDAHGCATTGALLMREQCAALAQTYAAEAPFRSRVVMARHGFGRGEYTSFASPLPDLVAALRSALYEPLAAIANRWHKAMGVDRSFPGDHASYLARCRRAGQGKPTPLLLQYGPGDYNCLHQD